MSCQSELWQTVATFNTAYPILTNFRQVRLKRLRITYDASEWYILHYMASTGPVWRVVGNGDQLWSRVSCLNVLVHFKEESRELGLVYKAMAYTALRDHIGQNCSKVAYNSTTVVTVPRYDRYGAIFVPALPLLRSFGTFCLVWSYYVKEPRKRESGQK